MEKKEIKMEAPKEAKKKLSYEELENVCHQLSEQSRRLYQRVQESDLTNMFKRLDYLFAVVENSKCFPNEFTTKCVQEIMDTLTIEESVEQPKEEEK